MTDFEKEFITIAVQARSRYDVTPTPDECMWLIELLATTMVRFAHELKPKTGGFDSTQSKDPDLLKQAAKLARMFAAAVDR